MTARDLIRISLIKIGVLSDAETPSGVQLLDGLRDLNMLVSSLSLESGFIYAVSREAFSLVNGQQVYTMGPSGDFETTRPVRFSEATFLDPYGVEYPVRILTSDEWAKLSLKDLAGAIVTKIYIEGTFPEVILHAWPKPLAGGTLVLNTKKPISEFTSADIEIVLPPGYELFLIYELGIIMAPGFGVSISAEHSSIAQGARERVFGINREPQLMETEASKLGRPSYFNIYTGENDC